MKKIIVLSFFIVLGIISVFAQDTLKVSQTQSQLEKSIENLQTGLENFQNQVSIKQNEVEIWTDSVKFLTTSFNNTKDEKFKILADSLQQLIDANKQKIEALNNGIQQITESIIDLNNQIANVDNVDIDTSYSAEADGHHNNYYDDYFDDTYSYDDPDDDFSIHQKRKFRGHWFGISLGVNSYIDDFEDFNLNSENNYMSVKMSKSFEFSANPLQFSLPFFNRYVGAVTGIGFTMNNYELAQNIDLPIDADGVIQPVFSNFNYTKNRFKTTSLTIPLLIEFQIRTNDKDKRLFLTVGVIGSYNIQRKMKFLYYDDNKQIKYKDKTTSWPVNKFNYSGTVRLGYRYFYLFANYSFLPLFMEGQGAQINPISGGLGLSI